MKIAIVCDDLIQHGGQENVVEEVLSMFPQAPLYTAVISRNWEKKLTERKIITSFMQKLPFVEQLNRYYFPLLYHILAMESFKLSGFDVVISISARFAHFVITKPSTKHLCLINTPGRMFWEPFDYFEHERYGLLSPLKKLGDVFVKIPSTAIRLLDYAAAQRVDKFIANSVTSQERVEKYYRRKSTILYPFINCKDFEKVKPGGGKYFVTITRLAPWKRVDVAVKACGSLGLPLKVVGSGPDMIRLKKIVKDEGFSSIEFMGYLSGEEKIEVLKNCIALIQTQKEDFGIVPLEAMACGKPVIAFGKGGALETVVAGRTGEFFYEQTPGSLKQILKSFDPTSYLCEECKKRASRFDIRFFEEGLRKEIGLLC